MANFTNNADADFQIGCTSGVTTIGPDVGVLALKSSNAERARIDSSGRLLVGTSTARSNINHRGTTGITPNVQFETATGSYNGGLSIINNSSAGYAATLTLGVSHGTTIGSNTLGSSGSQTGTISFSSSDGTNFIDCAQVRAEIDGTPGANDMPGRIILSTTADGASSPTERMRIRNDGEVLINRTSSFAVTHKFAVEASNQAVGIGTGSGTGLEAVRFYNGGTAVGTISTTASSTAYNTSSDYRLKENITSVTDGITRLQQLKPSRFNFIADPDSTVDGFIAHEVQEVVPEAIIGEKDAVDDDGNPIYQGIDQSKLVPLLTAALQEAIGEIESLKARVAALEAA